MRIQNNVPALNAHRFYTINNNGMTKSIAKLSSGYRINSAADDAAGLAISEKMRAQIRGLTMASKNAQDATSLIQTAEGGMQEIDNMIQRIRELVDYASNDTMEHNAYLTGDRQKVQDEINQLVQEIDSMADRVEFNKKKLLNGEVAGLAKNAADLQSGVTTAKNNLKTVQSTYSDAIVTFKNATTGAQAARDGFYSTLTDPNIETYLNTISINGGSTVSEDVDKVTEALKALKTSMDIATDLPSIKKLDQGDDGTSGLEAVEKAVKKLGQTLAAVPSGTAKNIDVANAAFDNLAKILGKDVDSKISLLRQAYEGNGGISPWSQLSDNIKRILDSDELKDALKSFENDVNAANAVAAHLGTLSGMDAVSVVTQPGGAAVPVTTVLAAGTGSLALLSAALSENKTANDALKALEATSIFSNLKTAATGVYLSSADDALLDFGTLLGDAAKALKGATNESTNPGVKDWTPGDVAQVQALADSLAKTSKILVDIGNSLRDAHNELEAALKDDGVFERAVNAVAQENAQWNAANLDAITKDPTKKKEIDPDNITVKDLNDYLEKNKSATSGGLTGGYSAYDTANKNLTSALGDLNNAKTELALRQQAIAAASKTGGLYFQIGANANQGVQLYINSVKSDNLGIGDGNGVSTISVLNNSGSNITAQLDTLDTALSYITTERAKLGAAQNRMEYTMNSLDISAENLTAAESRIRDVDMAKEMSNFTRQNILFQASTAMLAQANSMPQGVLQLLG